MRHPKYTEAWIRAAANEYGRLFQGCGRNEDGSQRIEGTNACDWIKKSQVLEGKTASYNRSVADISPEKKGKISSAIHSRRKHLKIY